MGKSQSSPAKVALRDQLLTTRRRRRLTDIGEAADEIAGHLLAATEIRRAATVACYVSLATEPGTTSLLDELRSAGKRVILPVLLSDNDLDWATYREAADLTRASRGMLEPSTPRLGPDAVAGADVVLVPGLAVAAGGRRLGRGGGSYDRALARSTGFTCVLLYDDELLPEIPTEPHDQAVDAAALPGGIVRFSEVAGTGGTATA
ncbi:MAG: 5-formyltetrahydrofolate cyclo-ligase [Nocardioidaceae bacterium]|nr:5-formyltetrahydrofolate cyclo-ligase [Nocardioidaceae bacterium]